MRSSRSSNGVRFQRLQRGQTTHNRPFHSSNAMRRPTPSPDGPPSPSNDALQKAQLTNILGSKSLRGERGNLYLGCSCGDQIYDDLAGERGQQYAVAPMPSGVPQPPHLGLGADNGASVVPTPRALPRVVVRRFTRALSVRTPQRCASARKARASAGASSAPSSGANMAPRQGAVAGNRSATSAGSSQSQRSPAWRWWA